MTEFDDLKRIHAISDTTVFQRFVYRYPDKQYQSWLGAHFTKVGIDFDYEPPLQDRVFAGIANHFMDVSFKRALSLAEGKQRDNPIPRFEKLFDRIEREFLTTSLAFFSADRPELKSEHTFLMHGELFLLRLLSSFKAARYLLNLGYFCEPLTILRSSLEQLSWAYAIGLKFDQQQFNKPKPSRCITTFQERFSSAGQLYGALSKYSHMEFDAQKHFVLSSPSRAGIMQQSTEFKFFGLLTYAFVIIAFQFLCRDICKFYRANYDKNYKIRNLVLPLKYLLSHSLMIPELDRDEIAATLSEIYFRTFPAKAAY